MNRFIILLAALIFSGCANMKVRTVSAPDFNALSYRSFCWIDGCEERYEGPAYALDAQDMRAIREQIGQTLESKNYLNDENAPDLLVGFHVVINEQQRLLSDSPEMSEPYQYPTSYWEDYDNYYERRKLFKYLKGSLVIDVIDANSGNIVWQSTTQGYMDLNMKLSAADLQNVISKALHQFPTRTTIVTSDLASTSTENR